ncbi:hypothetical protein [Megalodesulfovibrio gigas]|uniref:hypothetical protein n=1 Tax=Megalodesulfovibrio gigas TaxID=879 RepID=UPI000AFDC30C|nr:hypothetical protein [Megalodesulfovibrio gigas]
MVARFYATCLKKMVKNDTAMFQIMPQICRFCNGSSKKVSLNYVKTMQDENRAEAAASVTEDPAFAVEMARAF